tara:strand:+ start:59 stop:199 length:141 start_codon:yes stop_codon:yes gene_type:complete
VDKSVNDFLIFFPPKLRSNWSNIDQLEFKKIPVRHGMIIAQKGSTA